MTPDWADRFWSKVAPEPNSGCWLWAGATYADGYGTVSVKRRNTGAHRHAYELVHGPIPLGMFVCHRCDQPACVNPDHLFLGTHHDNMRDKAAKGRASRLRGERGPAAKLGAAHVHEIKRRLRTGEKQARLARDYGVARSTIGMISNGRNWQCLPPERQEP